MTGRIQPTKIRMLVLVAVLTGVVAWAGAVLWDNEKDWLPSVPVSAPLVLGFLAAIVGAIARGLSSRLSALRSGSADARPVDPVFTARALGLAKASAIVGALIAGLYGGFGVFLAADLDAEARREGALAAVFAVIAAVLLAAAGIWLERVLRVPPDEDESRREDAANRP